MPSSPAPPENMPPLCEDDSISSQDERKLECNGAGEEVQSPKAAEDPRPTKTEEEPQSIDNAEESRPADEIQSTEAAEGSRSTDASPNQAEDRTDDQLIAF